MNLILLEAYEVAATGEATLSDERAAHMTRVLHVSTGAPVRIGLVDGPRGSATVTRVGADGSVGLQCAFADAPPAPPAVDLLLALPRPKVMRRLWAQLAALGVRRIILTNAERVERNYFDTHVLGMDCYRPLLIEGLQQARDTRLPVVSVHRRLRVLVEAELDGLVGDASRVVADPGAHGSIRTVAPRHAGQRLLLAIGPEGGWSRFETDLFAAHGFQAAGIGPRTLRTDTACVALLALAHETWTLTDEQPG